MAAPLEELSRHCRAVTEGDLTARAASSSVAEIDQVARTHNEMLHSLSELLRHERDFTANASHPCAPRSPACSSPWRRASPRTTTPGCGPC
ncbi:HAMP domain-containing protein [Streptomyces sp. NPDC002763]|uniref:HAMP domain-containing protein n=1 Tax=Streptomyces sp. NPDC002763 TaxID=3154427 RepID=UPI00332CCFB3